LDKHELIGKIKNHLPYDHNIEIKSNSILSIRKSLFKTNITINPVFLKADDNTILDIIDFIKNKRGSVEIKKRLSAFYKKNRMERKVKLSDKSKNKNLNEEFQSVIKIINSKFPTVDMTKLKITWGRNTVKRTRVIRFGSFDLKNILIRIHPICDDIKIPDFFLRSIIFHEAAHFIHYEIHNSLGKHNILFYQILKQIDVDFNKSKSWEKNNKEIFFNL
jgi:predicted SprT family Zn-dependent metalloprotease